MTTRVLQNVGLRFAPRRGFWAFVAVTAISSATVLNIQAQTNVGPVSNLQANRPSPPQGDHLSLAQQARAMEEVTNKIRSDCIQGRRTICGRILKILPEGLVVESGYTSLLRPPLNQSWLAPATVQAMRDTNLVEANEPGCVCVGLVFLSDIPKSRRAKPKVYDYVAIQGYPEGDFTYTSVGTTQRTVRRFSAILQSAVRVRSEAAGINPPTTTAPTAIPATNRN